MLSYEPSCLFLCSSDLLSLKYVNMSLCSTHIVLWIWKHSVSLCPHTHHHPILKSFCFSFIVSSTDSNLEVCLFVFLIAFACWSADSFLYLLSWHLVPWLCCVLGRFHHVRLSVIPWTIAHQAPLSLGFSRQEYWSGLPCPVPDDLPHPGVECMSLTSPALQVNS